MPEIPSTRLGTSSTVDICKGFALFPELGTSRAGIFLNSSPSTLVDVKPIKVVAFRFSLNISFTLAYGVCGPAYAFQFTSSGSYDNSSLTLALSDDRFDAGFYAGASVSFAFVGGLDLLNLVWVQDGWNSRLEERWVSGVNLNFTFTIDVVELILQFILDGLKKGDGQKKTNKAQRGSDVLPRLGSFSIFGSEEQNLTSAAGRVTVSPQVDLPINIVSLLKKIPVVGPPLTALEKAGFTLAIGPTFSLVIPVDIQVVGFFVDGAKYESQLRWNATDGTVQAGYTSGPVPASPGQLGVTLKHTTAPRFGYKVGFFVNLFLGKFFNVGTDSSFNLPDLLKLKPNFGTFSNTVSNPVGSSAFGFDPLQMAGQEEEIEVVFEPWPA